MRLSLPAPPRFLTRQFPAFAMCWLIAGLSSMTVFFQMPPASGLGLDSGALGAAGNMLDCSDSGVLVAVARAGTERIELGNCPLKHTDVQATVSGYVSRVCVKQQFHNPYKEKIEAVYTFPLPQDAAVDEMTMQVGNRLIKGSIKLKEQARRTYEDARSQGHVASLLDQERPNIFTQAVANIEPGQNIDIEIKYVNLLKYENGAYAFVFPTVVGPRFIPGRGVGRSGNGIASDTEIVPDASKVSPPTAAPGERAGHDISISLDIDACVPIQSISSKLHDVDIQKTQANRALVKLKGKDKIPNKDFVLSWNLAQESLSSGYLAHKVGDEGFFSLMLVPPKKVSSETAQPKEMVFLIDCSGSQHGKPIEKAKETMRYIMEHMNPQDSFQLVSFNNGCTIFPDKPEIASRSLLDRSLSVLNELQAQGGTWMAPAVERVCRMPRVDHRLRIVTFMTDGYVGNDFEVLSLIRKFRNDSRWFSFGTGNSVNRFLIDGIASEGGGEADYVLLNSSADEVGKKFYDRIKSPVLTDIKLSFEGVEVKDIYPKEVSDLWAQRPLYFTGRYTKAGKGKVVLSGFAGGKPYKQELAIVLPEEEKANDAIPSVWARAKVERLMREDWQGLQLGSFQPELKEDIVKTALKYHLMSQFTSFVAVEEDRKTKPGEAHKVAVPVETPDGVEMERPNYVRSIRARRGGGGGGAGGHGLSSSNYYQPGTFSMPSAGAPALPPSPLPNANGTGMKGGGASSAALPQTNMGKYIHQPGDNQYSVSGRGSGFPAGSGYYKVRTSGYSNYYNGSSGSVHGALAAGRKTQAPAAFYSAPRQVQIIEEKPAVRDFRSAPGVYVGSSESFENLLPEPKSEKKKNKAANEKKAHIPASLSKLLDKNLRQLYLAYSDGKKEGSTKLNLKLEFNDPVSDALINELKACGFELVKRGRWQLVGRIKLERLAGLAGCSKLKLASLL